MEKIGLMLEGRSFNKEKFIRSIQQPHPTEKIFRICAGSIIAFLLQEEIK
jgi:hypothetical protein